jgi:putative tributyrin esterase
MSSSFRTISVSDPRYTRDGLHYITVKTPHLSGRGDITVWLPEGEHESLPLVLLLHGVYGSHWAWTLKGGVHHTARTLIEKGEIRPMALAMPSDGLFGDGSGYLPHSGRDFEKWIVEDVPTVVSETFPQVQPEAAGLFITGLSMGGYGAMRLGARYSLRFAGFSGHSSITTLRGMGQFVEENLGLYQQQNPGDESVLVQMAGNYSSLPPFRFDCGLDDDLLSDNRVLHEQLLNLGIPHSYEEYPGGHEWDYWAEHIGKSLRFFSGFVRS